MPITTDSFYYTLYANICQEIILWAPLKIHFLHNLINFPIVASTSLNIAFLLCLRSISLLSKNFSAFCFEAVFRDALKCAETVTHSDKSASNKDYVAFVVNEDSQKTASFSNAESEFAYFSSSAYAINRMQTA